MRECLREGELRAWLDGELPVEQAPGVEQHLAECAGCAAAYQQISARAARVSGWMESLSPDIPMPVAMPRRWMARPAVWAGVAALAAGLVLAVVLSRPSGRPAVHALVTPAPAQVALREAPMTTEAATVSTPAAPRIRRAPVRRARTIPVQYYMALDEEPIDTGLVMRVALASGIQADVIVDGDGRARAIRPISVAKEEE